jgi:membrane-associated protease RseP (regulator of RpoE activity)
MEPVLLYVLGVLVVVIGLAVSIGLHELGHLWPAKAFGVRVGQWMIGFGPTLFSRRRGETEYGVKAIPAGGYVRIVGMNSHEPIDEADRDRVFYTQPAWQRLIVLVAGSFTHFVIAAVLIFVALAGFALPRLEDGAPVASNVVGQVVAGDPADAAGLRPGDEIVAVDGTATASFSDVVDVVSAAPGETLTVTVLRDGRELRREVTLASSNPSGEQVGYLGVAAGSYVFDERSAGEALRGVFVGEYSVPTTTWRSLVGIGQIFTPESLSRWLSQADTDNARTTDGPISLIGAAQVGNELVELGATSQVLLLLAQLNIVLGALNMLPLPPLDGGHVAVLAVERGVNAVRGRTGRSTDWELDPAVITPVALAVMLFLGIFGITALYIDLVNPASQLLQ